MDRQPVAYIRRSYSRRGDPGDRSREFQIDTVRRLAGADVPAIAIMAGDWGVSASRHAIDKRHDFQNLLERVKAGHVSTVYAYSADRLARSTQWAAALLDACKDAGTTIVTSEGRYAPDDFNARQMFRFLAAINEGAIEQAEQKAQDTIATRRKNGLHLGPAPYGQKVVDGQLVANPDERVDLVIDAYQQAGSVSGAAALLQKENRPTRSGKAWRASTVRGILDRQGVLPRRIPRGRPAARPYLFQRLLRCHCGATMTGRANTKGRRGFAYECKNRASRNHGSSSISERRLRPIIETEADNLVDFIQKGSGDEARRAELLETRAALLDLAGSFPVEEIKRRADAIDAELDSLDVVERMKVIPRLDWSKFNPDDERSVGAYNEALRAMFAHVQLGPDMLPTAKGFAWRRDEWRA